MKQELDVDHFLAEQGEQPDLLYLELWRAVLFQAILDGAVEPRCTAEKLDKEKARRWILEDNGAFKFVCMMADRCHEQVRRDAQIFWATGLKEMRSDN